MDINSIYSEVFPIGGIDDNNDYIDLSGDKISTVQLIEPTVSVAKLGITKKEEYDKNNRVDKYAYRIPIVEIDNCRIQQLYLKTFKLDYSGFLPSIKLEFVDFGNEMLSTSVPKEGSIIKVYIGGFGDESYYKPIRQDFILNSIKRVPNAGGNQNEGGFFRYKVCGSLNVPYGYRRESWCCGDSTAMQALFNMAIWTGLGFATNFTKSNEVDNMCWRNNETSSYFDFIQNISDHACYSPNTFFTSFIDQYNVLNFIECHSLLSHGGNKTDIPAMIYRSYPPANSAVDKPILKPDETDIMNSTQKLSYYYISNNEIFNGWTNFIEEYVEISNGSTLLSSGSMVKVSYSDSNGGSWGDFLIRPIDNLKRDSTTQKIEPLSDEPTQQSYIPLNLVQMRDGDYASVESLDCMSNATSYKSFGEVDTSNMFKQYFFAEVQNRFQMSCLKKCGLKVVLQTYNPSITKFSRIWVDIYDKNMNSNNQIVPTEVRKYDSGDLSDYKEWKNSNILYFRDEGVIEDIETPSRKNKNWPRGNYNRSLSGWYVITEVAIEYSPIDNSLKHKLTLNRIEYQPIYKTDYKQAKMAVDKYREENLIENLV